MLALIDGSPVLQLLALTIVCCGALCWVVTFWSIPTSFLSGAAAAAGIAWINSIGNLGGHFGPDLIGRLLGGIVVLLVTRQKHVAAPSQAAS